MLLTLYLAFVSLVFAQQYLGIIYPYIVRVNYNYMQSHLLLTMTRLDMEQTQNLENGQKILYNNFELLPKLYNATVMKQSSLMQITVKEDSILITDSMHIHQKILVPNYHSYIQGNLIGNGSNNHPLFIFSQSKYLELQDFSLLDSEYYIAKLQQNTKEFFITCKRQTDFSEGLIYGFQKRQFQVSYIEDIHLFRNPNSTSLLLVFYTRHNLCKFSVSAKCSLDLINCKQDVIHKLIELPGSILYLERGTLDFENNVTQIYGLYMLEGPQFQTKCQIQISTRHVDTHLLGNYIGVYQQHSTKISIYNTDCVQIASVQWNEYPVNWTLINLIEYPALNAKVSYLKIYDKEGQHSIIFICQDSTITYPIQLQTPICPVTTISRCNNDSLHCFECNQLSECIYNKYTSRCEKYNKYWLFDMPTYQNKQAFTLQFAHFMYGKDSKCISEICRSTKITEVFTEISIDKKSCYYFQSISSYSKYRLEPQKYTLSLKITVCENDIYQYFDMDCQKDSFVLNFGQGIYFKGLNYVLIYFEVSDPTLSMTLGLVNTESQLLSKSIKMFTTFFIVFTSILLLIIAIKILWPKIKLLLAWWGWLPYQASNRYPMDALEYKIVIDRLCTDKIMNKFEFVVNSKQQVQQCPFCLEELQPNDTILRIYCRHQFHEKCLGDWIKKEKNSRKCPICKRGFTSADMQIFQLNAYSYNID